MIDTSLVVDLRTTIQHIRTNEWARIAMDLQYQDFTKVLPSNTLHQTYLQLLEGQVIRDYGEDGGGVRFDEQVLAQHTYTNHVHKWGWGDSLIKFEDLDQNGIVGGEGINLLTQASTDATAAAAYYPQKLAIAALRAGETTVLATDNGNKFKLQCYDGKALFALDHPYNFKRTALGTFANLFVNTATTTPKFLPLAGPFKKNASTGVWEYTTDGTMVSVEDGYDNLWETITYITGNIKMPDGVTPRKLKPSKIVAGPKCRKNLTTMLNAKFISTRSGSSGGGSTEIEAVIRTLGLAEPTFLDELGGLGTNEEYDWYIFCEANQNASQLGAINIGMRKPWKINVFTGQRGGEGGEGAIQMELAISDDMVAIGSMRMFVGVGLPQFAFKNKAPRS